MVYELEDVLQESSLETVLENGKQAVILVTGRECQETLAKLGIFLENEISLSKINFCKLETQQEYLYGTLAIPRFLDITGSRYQMSLLSPDSLLSSPMIPISVSASSKISGCGKSIRV